MINNDYNGINQLMIDIETMGTTPGSVILSIGAVMFDLDSGEVGEKLHLNIDPKSCVRHGLIIDPDTMVWWLKQSKESQLSFLNAKRVELEFALDKLSNFIAQFSPDGIWGNSNRFDLGILESAFKTCNMKTPWPFWAERDVRTLVSFAPHIKESCVNILPHDPISDCLFQIEYCSKIYRYITGSLKQDISPLKGGLNALH